MKEVKLLTSLMMRAEAKEENDFSDVEEKELGSRGILRQRGRRLTVGENIEFFCVEIPGAEDYPQKLQGGWKADAVFWCWITSLLVNLGHFGRIRTMT